jgi:DNA-binding NarL/FixJ family response regulator
VEPVALPVRILVVDDQGNFRRMLRSFLEMNPGWQVCGEASDGWEAIVRSIELNPDIVIMDLEMPKLNGLEATRRIHKLCPSTQVLILTFHKFSSLPRIAEESGAQGVVLKSELSKALAKAIDSLSRSYRYITPPPPH